MHDDRISNCGLWLNIDRVLDYKTFHAGFLIHVLNLDSTDTLKNVYFGYEGRNYPYLWFFCSETIYISDFVLVDLHEGPLQGKINRL